MKTIVENRKIKNKIYILTISTLSLVAAPASPQVFAAQQTPSESEDFFEMSLEELMEIEVITPSKKAEDISDAPSVVTVVNKEQIRMFGAKNILDVLNRMPSVYTTGSYMFGQNIASVRGDLATHHNNHTLVLINGRPFRESIQGGLNYPLFTAYPIEMVERIELIRGPGSVFYGTNAFTAVINIITKRTEQSELTLSSEGGSFGYYSNSIAGGKDCNDLNFYAAFQQQAEDGWQWSATDEAGVHKSLSNRQSSESIAARIQSGSITFDLFFTRQKMNRFGRIPLWSLIGGEMDTKRLFANLGYNLPLNDKWRVETHATLNYNRFVIETGNLYHQSRDVLGEITLFGQPTDKLDVVAGYIIEHLATPHSGRSSIQRYSIVPLSAYGQAGYRFFDNMKLFSGVQWNEPEDGDGDFISRFGAIIDITDKWGIKLLRGEAFRSPWPGETIISNPELTGNPNLDPEKITTHDIQLFYRSPKTQLAVTYFHNTMKGMITRVVDGGGFTYENGGDMDFWGFELEGKHSLTDKLYALGSVTYQDSEQDLGLNPSFVPNRMGKLGFGYSDDKLSIGLFYTYFSTPPKISGASKVNPQPDAIHWISANLNYDVTELFDLDKLNATLTFRVENLLDEDVDHPEFGRRNINSLPGASGIAFYGGIRLEF